MKLRVTLIVILACTLIAAVWSIWDYYEARRLRRVAEEIRSHGEPITVYEASLPLVASDAPPTAGRYYAAAGVVAARGPEGWRIAEPLRAELEASPHAAPAESVLEAVREQLMQNEAAFELLRKARDERFTGFTYAERQFVTYVSARERLARLLSAQSLVSAVSGDADTAIEGLLEIVRLGPLFDVGRSIIELTQKLSMLERVPTDLPLVLERGEASDAALTALQAAVTQALPPNDLERYFLGQRATYLEVAHRRLLSEQPESGLPRTNNLIERRLMGPGSLTLVARPWLRRQFVSDIRHLNALVEASRRPFKDAIETIRTLDAAAPAWEWRPWPSSRGLRVGMNFFGTLGELLPFTVARLRAAETALMIERYRIVRGELPDVLDALVPLYGDQIPEDPFTGEPLVYRREALGYTVYSVGANGVDDDGALTPPPSHRAPSVMRGFEAADWGIRVRR